MSPDDEVNRAPTRWVDWEERTTGRLKRGGGRMRRFVPAIVLAVAAAGCGGGSGVADTRSAAARSGQEIFEERILGSNPGCITCHSLDAGTTLVGPSLAGIAGRAGSRVAGLSAEDYLRQSLTTPSAFVVDGFADGKMPGDLADVLTPEEIDAVVAYLLTLD